MKSPTARPFSAPRLINRPDRKSVQIATNPTVRKRPKGESYQVVAVNDRELLSSGNLPTPPHTPTSSSVTSSIIAPTNTLSPSHKSPEKQDRAEESFNARTLPGTLKRLKKAQANNNHPSAINDNLSWRKASPAQRFVHSIITAGRQNGRALNLNLSRQLEDQLCSHPDPTRLLSHYINRELKQSFGDVLPYSFILEISPEGRLHAHGVIVPRADTDLSALKRALMRAGGRLQGRKGSRQVKVPALEDALGWASYVAKNESMARKSLQTEKITFVSKELKNLCRIG